MCPRQELNLCSPGFNRKLYQLSYRGETCAPTRIRAGGRRARSSGGGNRTRDHWLMKPALCQLSYARIHAANSARTLSRAPLDTAPVFIFRSVGRTRTYGLRLIRSVLSPTELRRKETKTKLWKERPTQREHYMPLWCGRQTDIASDRKEETKPATPVR